MRGRPRKQDVEEGLLISPQQNRMQLQVCLQQRARRGSVAVSPPVGALQAGGVKHIPFLSWRLP
jgi:hypothetical protein